MDFMVCKLNYKAFLERINSGWREKAGLWLILFMKKPTYIDYKTDPPYINSAEVNNVGKQNTLYVLPKILTNSDKSLAELLLWCETQQPNPWDTRCKAVCTVPGTLTMCLMNELFLPSLLYTTPSSLNL